MVNEKGETDPAYRVGVLAITVLTLLTTLSPLSYHFNLLLNLLFVVLPKTSTQLVDTYCSELKRVLLDAAGEDAQRATDAEKQGRHSIAAKRNTLLQGHPARGTAPKFCRPLPLGPRQQNNLRHSHSVLSHARWYFEPGVHFGAQQTSRKSPRRPESSWGF